MSTVPITGAYLSATVPDGPVNRHVQVSLQLDTDTGAVTGTFDLAVARGEALDSKGQLPSEQIAAEPTDKPDAVAADGTEGS